MLTVTQGFSLHKKYGRYFFLYFTVENYEKQLDRNDLILVPK
jgi:hypothetical protein